MRTRIAYKKLLALRFTSALDVQRIWERSIRRAGIDLAYSQGFHPQPKIQLGLPLPLGYISDCEHVDFWPSTELDLAETNSVLQSVVPNGIEILSTESVVDNSPPLVSNITTSEYVVKFWDESISREQLETSTNRILECKEIIREKRNGKKYDLRPLLLELKLFEKEQSIGGFVLFLKLVSRQEHMGRADEVVLAMGFSLRDFLIKRIRSY